MAVFQGPEAKRAGVVLTQQHPGGWKIQTWDTSGTATHGPQTEAELALASLMGGKRSSARSVALKASPRAPTFLPGRPELDAGLLKGFLQLCTARLLLLQGQLQFIVLERNLCGQSRVLFPSTK